MGELRKHRDGERWDSPCGRNPLEADGTVACVSTPPAVLGRQEGSAAALRRLLRRKVFFHHRHSPQDGYCLLPHLAQGAWEAGWSGHLVGAEHGLGPAPFLADSGHLTRALEASASCPVQWESGLPCLPHGTVVRLCTRDGRRTPDEKRQRRHEECCLHPRVYGLLGILSI